MERKPNLWNIWRHYKKKAEGGQRADVWAFNLIKCLMPKDKLQQYEER